MLINDFLCFVLSAQCAMCCIQSCCVLPRCTVYQRVAGMSKRPPPNIHRYVTKKRRHSASLKTRLDWAEPLFKSEEERKQKALENVGKEAEPHMLHVVYLRKQLKGRPWWEKKIAKELQIKEVCRNYLLLFLLLSYTRYRKVLSWHDAVGCRPLLKITFSPPNYQKMGDFLARSFFG